MARALVDRFSGELTLLHVEPLQEEIPVAISAKERIEKFARRLQEFARRPDFDGLNVRTVVLQGDPAHGIVKYAHEQHTDLIVMPTRGYGPLRRFLLGSVTVKVLQDAGCPVWADAHMEELLRANPGQFRNIVCAVDLSDQNQPTLHWASQFAEETGAHLRVVQAIPSVTVGGPEFLDTNWPETLEEQAKDDVDSLQAREGTHAEVEIVSGEVALAVGSAASEAHADLLVIGRTHAYPIIRHAPCPVVSV
jgi:nucleotide-binding universal stress UspA family protein